MIVRLDSKRLSLSSNQCQDTDQKQLTSKTKGNKSMKTTHTEKNPRPIARRMRHTLGALVIGVAITSFAWLAARADGGATHMSWDLIHLIGSDLTAGGSDSATAAHGSQITLTGPRNWA